MGRAGQHTPPFNETDGSGNKMPSCEPGSIEDIEEMEFQPYEWLESII